MKKRIIGLDVLRFLATLAIFNHLAQRFYGQYSFLATGGVIGCSLFFFCSGYALSLKGLDRFDKWYKRRLMRVWPTCLMAGILAGLRGFDGSVLYALEGRGWFVSCILCHYFLYYWLHFLFRGRDVLMSIVVACGMCLWYVLWFPREGLGMSVFGQNHFKWGLYFCVFVFGAINGSRSTKTKEVTWLDCLCLFLSLILFYAWQVLAARNQLLTTWQIGIMIPLMVFVNYSFKVMDSRFVRRIMGIRWLEMIVLIIGGLSLEYYLCGGVVTQWIPSHWPVVSYMLALIVALLFSYIVRCSARFFAQTLNPSASATGGYDWRGVFRLLP